MARLVAPFTTSGNNPDLLPKTPFQVLYIDPATLDILFEDGGIIAFATNHFVVPTGTMFYLPIVNSSDTPPDTEVFPTSSEEAVPFFFGRSQQGVKGVTVIVDGKATEAGPQYLSDLLSFPKGLPDGSTRFLTLGTFLTPLSPGTHTITIRGAFTGTGFQERNGIAFLAFEFTYTVEVVPRGKL